MCSMNVESPKIPEGYVTVHGAAEILGVSADTVKRHAKKGLIKASRSSNNHRIFRIEELRRLSGKKKNKAKWRVLKRPKNSGSTGVKAIEMPVRHCAEIGLRKTSGTLMSQRSISPLTRIKSIL